MELIRKIRRNLTFTQAFFIDLAVLGTVLSVGLALSVHPLLMGVIALAIYFVIIRIILNKDNGDSYDAE